MVFIQCKHQIYIYILYTEICTHIRTPTSSTWRLFHPILRRVPMLYFTVSAHNCVLAQGSVCWAETYRAPYRDTAAHIHMYSDFCVSAQHTDLVNSGQGQTKKMVCLRRPDPCFLLLLFFQFWGLKKTTFIFQVSPNSGSGRRNSD